MPFVLYPYDQGLGRGSTSGPITGSGKSVPGGVESTFEYNNLLMNYRKWWDTFLITNITGFASADVRDQREDKPSQHGENAYQSFYSGRTITLSGKIRAFTLDKLRDLEQAMRYAFRELETYPLIVRSGRTDTDITIDCKPFAPLDIVEEQVNYNHERNFQISLRAAYPFFSSVKQEYLSADLNGSNWSGTVVNNGNFDSPTKIKFYGPLTGVVVTNLTTGKILKLNSALAAGKTLELDSRYYRSVDQDGLRDFQTVDVLSDWLFLAPGINKLQITRTAAGSAASHFELSWKHTWV